MPAPKMSAVSSVELEVCDCEFKAVPAPCGGELLGEHMWERQGRWRLRREYMPQAGSPGVLVTLAVGVVCHVEVTDSKERVGELGRGGCPAGVGLRGERLDMGFPWRKFFFPVEKNRDLHQAQNCEWQRNDGIQ